MKKFLIGLSLILVPGALVILRNPQVFGSPNTEAKGSSVVIDPVPTPTNGVGTNVKEVKTPATNKPTAAAGSDTLNMVMVDQAKLSAEERQAFQQFLQTANVPTTKIGKQCQFYGRPQVWCIIQDKAVAEQAYNQLKINSSFGKAVELKTVRRFRGVEGGG
jgi:hypothetical protein